MIRIEIQYLNKDASEVKVDVIDARAIYMVRLCSKELERDIYLDRDQFIAAFMQEMPEKLSVYQITEDDVGKMITVAKG
jgi:hypothetical protein